VFIGAGWLGIKPEKLDNPPPIFFCGFVLILFPFLDCGVRESRPEHLTKLPHRQGSINPPLPKMFTKGGWGGRVVA
jgi:hypothetical protein